MRQIGTNDAFVAQMRSDVGLFYKAQLNWNVKLRRDCKLTSLNIDSRDEKSLGRFLNQ